MDDINKVEKSLNMIYQECDLYLKNKDINTLSEKSVQKQLEKMWELSKVIKDNEDTDKDYRYEIIPKMMYYDLKLNFPNEDLDELYGFYEAYNEYMSDEFLSYFDPIINWEEIPLAYTEVGDDEYPVQVILNVKKLQLTTTLTTDTDEIIEIETYKDYRELRNSMELSSFDMLISCNYLLNEDDDE